ncbi:MAG: SIMPL domain-containing protein [Candidatus Omnitrophota bacterium]|nr:SIMPL domain-containing protein [Candidatus Omnitrophota bacterium]
MKKTAIAISTTLALCGTLVWIATIGADTALSIKNKGYVSVKGYAKQTIKSNMGMFGATIKAKSPELQPAYDKLAADRKATLAFLKPYEFPDKDVRFSPVEVAEKHKVTERGYDTHEFVHFGLSQTVRAQSSDVEKIARLSAEIGEILGQGVELVISAPEYIYTGLEELKVEMIGLATASAAERAKTIAQKGGFKLGNIASVRVGIFQITPAYSTEVHDYGINDTTSIDKEIKSVVDVQYFVR